MTPLCERVLGFELLGLGFQPPSVGDSSLSLSGGRVFRDFSRQVGPKASSEPPGEADSGTQKRVKFNGSITNL